MSQNSYKEPLAACLFRSYRVDGHESATLPSEGGRRANEIIIEEEVRKISKIKQESSEKEKKN